MRCRVILSDFIDIRRLVGAGRILEHSQRFDSLFAFCFLLFAFFFCFSFVFESDKKGDGRRYRYIIVIMEEKDINWSKKGVQDWESAMIYAEVASWLCSQSSYTKQGKNNHIRETRLPQTATLHIVSRSQHVYYYGKVRWTTKCAPPCSSLQFRIFFKSFS